MHPLTAESLAVSGFPGKKKRTKHRHIVSMFGPIMVRVSLKDLAKPSKINGLQAASKVFYLLLFVLCQKSSDGVIYWIGCI